MLCAGNPVISHHLHNPRIEQVALRCSCMRTILQLTHTHIRALRKSVPYTLCTVACGLWVVRVYRRLSRKANSTLCATNQWIVYTPMLCTQHIYILYYYTILYFILYYTTLYYTILLYYTIVHYTILHYTILFYYTILHYIIKLYYTI